MQSKAHIGSVLWHVHVRSCQPSALKEGLLYARGLCNGCTPAPHSYKYGGSMHTMFFCSSDQQGRYAAVSLAPPPPALSFSALRREAGGQEAGSAAVGVWTVRNGVRGRRRWHHMDIGARIQRTTEWSTGRHWLSVACGLRPSLKTTQSILIPLVSPALVTSAPLNGNSDAMRSLCPIPLRRPQATGPTTVPFLPSHPHGCYHALNGRRRRTWRASRRLARLSPCGGADPSGRARRCLRESGSRPLACRTPA